MTCCGKFIFIMCFIFSAAATCSFFFPLVRSKKESTVRTIYQYYGEEKVPMWHILDLLGTNPYPANTAMNDTTGSVHAFVRTNMWHTNCKPTRIMFTVSTITATIGTALSGMSAIVLSVFCCKMKKPKVQRVVRVASVFSFFAFLLLVVSVAMIAVVYTADTCLDDKYRFLALKTSGYNLVEGFGLLCAGAGGMLLVSLFQCCM